MRTHTWPTPDWVESNWRRLAIALWGHTVDQHHTGFWLGEGGGQYLYEDTHYTNTTLGSGRVNEVDNSSMRTHTWPTSHWVHAGWRRWTIALWGHTLDQNQAGLRQVEGGGQYHFEDTHYTNTRQGWGKLKEVDNSSMRTHTRPTPVWVEASLRRWTIALRTHTRPTPDWVEASKRRWAISLWVHTLDQHQTGLRQVEGGEQQLYENTH